MKFFMKDFNNSFSNHIASVTLAMSPLTWANIDSIEAEQKQVIYVWIIYRKSEKAICWMCA